MNENSPNSSPLLPPNTYMRLGRKAFWIFTLGQNSVGASGIVIAVFLFLLSTTPSGASFEATIHIPLATAGVVVLLLSILFVAIALFQGWLWYVNYEFRLGDNAFEIRRGILAREEIAVPYRHIQDVNIDQTLLFRMIGLSVVRILTAGHAESGEGGETEEVLPALEKNVAEALRQELLRRTNVQEVTEVQAPTGAPG